MNQESPQINDELNFIVEAKARILLANAMNQLEKYKQCPIRDEILNKITEIFVMLDALSEGEL